MLEEFREIHVVTLGDRTKALGGRPKNHRAVALFLTLSLTLGNLGQVTSCLCPVSLSTEWSQQNLTQEIALLDYTRHHVMFSFLSEDHFRLQQNRKASRKR